MTVFLAYMAEVCVFRMVRVRTLSKSQATIQNFSGRIMATNR